MTNNENRIFNFSADFRKYELQEPEKKIRNKGNCFKFNYEINKPYEQYDYIYS